MGYVDVGGAALCLKMVFSCKNCLLVTYVIPLLALAVASFAGTLILAIIGIGKASESNACLDNGKNQTCINPSSIKTSETDNDPGRSVSGDMPNEFLYWMAGATGCGFLFAIIATLSLWALEDVVRRVITRPQQSLAHATEMEMEAEGDSADTGPQSPTPPPEPDPIDIIDGCKVLPKSQGVVKPLDFGSLIALFLSCLFGILSLLCLLWAIAVGVNHSKQQDITVTPFIVVELLAAVGFPVFFVIGFLFMANVLDYITCDAVDARTVVPRFLRAVKFKKGEKMDHWIIENTLYFSLKKREKDSRFSCYPNFATWALVSIVSLAFIFSVSSFADIALDKQISVTSCSDPRIDRTFTCFNSSTLVHVNCTDNPPVEFIHCFKFYRFGVEVNLIRSLTAAYVAFLVASAIFGYIFVGVKILLHITKKRIWGALMIVSGVLMFLGSIVLVFIWLSGYVSATLGEITRLNLIKLAQIVMVSWFLLLTGLLMVKGVWAEKEKKPKQA